VPIIRIIINKKLYYHGQIQNSCMYNVQDDALYVEFSEGTRWDLVKVNNSAPIISSTN